MANQSTIDSKNDKPYSAEAADLLSKIDIHSCRERLKGLSPEDRLRWAADEFGDKFVLTTSFGIQSAVLLHMLQNINNQNSSKVLWIDTGYLPSETYRYSEQLEKELNLDLIVIQSDMSPARMEAIHGKLWESNSVKDLEKYHFIRKVNPLEEAFKDLGVICWASGVRGQQTKHRSTMTHLDIMRNRLSLRPLLEWTQKEVYYYMEKNNLPQHPLFKKGFSTVGDWHSSQPDNAEKEGRETRFNGLKQECGIHLSTESGDNT